jgi:hypothetical protein
MKPINWKTHRPHPEEARSAVSKDGDWRGLARLRLSFETPATRAPQDEAGGTDMIRIKETLN